MTELLARIKNLINQRKNLQKRFREEIVIQPGEITVTSVDKLFLQRAISTVEESFPTAGKASSDEYFGSMLTGCLATTES